MKPLFERFLKWSVSKTCNFTEKIIPDWCFFFNFNEIFSHYWRISDQGFHFIRPENTKVKDENIQDSHRENTPSNKTQALTKSMNMCIREIGASNQLFIRGSYTEIKSSKNRVVSGKTAFFVISPIFSPHSLCLNNGFR